MSRRSRMLLSIASIAAVAVAGFAPSAALADDESKLSARHGPPQPDKVVVIVVDALSKEIVDKYAMSNTQQMMADGVDTPNSYLGHLGSVTVVTHNVITSGQLPKNMGWTDEGYRDVDGVLSGQGGVNPDSDLWLTSDWSSEQMFAVQEHAGYPKLADYLHTSRPGSQVVTISPKTYAGYAMGGSGSDSIVTFGSSTTCPDMPGSWRAPGGINVPNYIATPCGRYYVPTGSDLRYDTLQNPASLYALDGDRYVTGKNPDHYGGDVWAADAAVDVMRNEDDWSGIFVTLPGVDKAAHMWGGVNDPGATGPDGDPMTHMTAAAATADAQVGKILGELEDTGELDSTLVVLTADHGSVAGTDFFGAYDPEPNYGYYNWYYGSTANADYQQPQPALKALTDTGNIEFSYSDSMSRVWLKDQSRAKKRQAARIMADMPNVSAVWSRNGDRFNKVSRVQWRNMKSKEEKRWFYRKAQELVNTEAAPYGPDLIATFFDDTTYSVAGDHGGIQRASQIIPIVFAGGGLSSRDIGREVRSVDIMPMVLRQLGIEATQPMDGHAYWLPRAKGSSGSN